MYRLIRNTHLIVGLFAVFFILTYAVSAVQMAHAFRLNPQVSEDDALLPPGMEPRPLAQRLMDERGYQGDLGVPQTTPQGFRLSINRPGASYVISYDLTTGHAHIRREIRGLMGLLNRLHHQNGLHHADGVLNAWGWALAFVSCALLVIGCSGVYMWYRLHGERITGSILLAANLIVSLGILTALRL
jgi:hypothetical protein